MVFFTFMIAFVFSAVRLYVIMPHHPLNCTLHNNVQALCVCLKSGETERAREEEEDKEKDKEENEDEVLDVCLENKNGLNDKTLPMNKSASGQGRPVSVSIKGDE